MRIIRIVQVLLQKRIKYDMFDYKKNALFTFLRREMRYRFLFESISVFLTILLHTVTRDYKTFMSLLHINLLRFFRN